MKEKIRQYCKENELFGQGDRVLLGFSGGADSVCLLFVLLSLREEWKLTLLPVHVHHHLRGEEADRDQHFCEAFCQRLGLPILVRSVEVRKLAQAHGWTLEEAGRNARYQVFSELAREYDCDRIAVAHHQNDQAETVLFQLIRGSRLQGLSGISPKNGQIVRPLLGVSRGQIEQYLRKNGLDYCVDTTNLTEEYTRNRIRNRILPELQGIQPRAVGHIAKTAEYLRRVEQYLEKESAALYERVVRKEEALRLELSELLAADPLLAERVLYRALCEVSGQKKDITAQAVEKLWQLAARQTGRRVNLSGKVTARKSYGELVLECGTPEAGQPFVRQEISCFPFRTRLDADTELCLELLELGEEPAAAIEKNGGIPKSTYTKWFDYDKMKGVIALRSPEDGDVLSLYADGRGKSLQAVCKDCKVPKERRKRIIVLAEEERVIWAFGIRSSEAYRITDGTKRILSVKIQGGRDYGREN